MTDKAMCFILDAVKAIDEEENPDFSTESIFSYAMGCIDLAAQVGIISSELASLLEEVANYKKEVANAKN